MYRYWVVSAKVPVNKVISVSKYLARFNWFGGSLVVNDNFPRGLATIYFRMLQTVESFGPIGDIIIELPELLKSNIKIYHTSENEDTWKPAHLPRNLRGQKSSLLLLLLLLLSLGLEVYLKFMIFEYV
jgi:hypothetical protein